MTDEEIQRARARYARWLDESVYTGADMLRLLESVEAALKEGARERNERNQLIALLAALFPSSLEDVPLGPKAFPIWTWWLIVDLPTGALAWDVVPDELPLFDHVPRRQGRPWEGWQQAEREQRIRAWVSSADAVKETTAVPKGLPSAGDAMRDVGTLCLADAFRRALHDRFLHVRGAVTWEWQAIRPHWTTADIYTVNLRIVASDNRLWSEASHDTDAIDEDASDAGFRETYRDASHDSEEG